MNRGDAPVPAQALEDLKNAARIAARRAYAPQSRFQVGAAVLDASGRIHSGCNVETAAHTAVHAEEAAIAAWVLGGESAIVAIAISGPDGAGVPPCGMCRQLLSELAPEMLVVVGAERHTAKELLPGSFSAANLRS